MAVAADAAGCADYSFWPRGERSVDAVLKAIPKASQGCNRSEVVTEALASCVKLLMQHPEKLPYLEGLLKKACAENDVEPATDVWAKQPKVVGALDKGWVAQWLTQHDRDIGSNPALSREFLDGLESHDPKIILNIFHMFTATSHHTEMPEPMRRSKALCGLVFTKRSQDLGLYMRGWRQSCMLPDGSGLNMHTAGAYQLVYDATGLLQKVTYMRGVCETLVDQDKIRVTRDFSLVDPFSVQNATVTDGQMCSYKVLDFFPKHSDPHIALVPSGKAGKSKASALWALATNAESDQEEARKTIQRGFIEQVPDFVGQERKSKMKEALQQASLKASANAKRRRTVSLNDACLSAGATTGPAPLQGEASAAGGEAAAAAAAASADGAGA